VPVSTWRPNTAAAVIVETYLQGDDHRLLVINGELIAATRRTPGRVVGDGTRTIRQLVDAVNLDPRRGIGHEKVMTRIELDAQADMMLKRQGLSPDSVPAEGQVGLTAQHRQPVHRRHGHRRDRHHPPRQPRDGGARRHRHRAGRGRRGLPLCPDIAESYKTPENGGGASARSTPRRAFACTWRRAKARRATPPGR
jgi:cyanophycin synthetase